MLKVFIMMIILLVVILNIIKKLPEREFREINEKKGASPKKIAYRVVLIFGIVILTGMVGSGCFYQISEQEAAVVTTFGVPKAVTETGLHFKIPFIQQVEKVSTIINGIPMGYRISGDSTVNVESEALMITNDYNFVNVDFYIEYRTVDPAKYLYASTDPVEILKNVSQSWIRDTIGSYNVDAVLTTGKGEIQTAIKEHISEELEKMDIGIQLVNITIQDAEPPTDEVMIAFKAVETAKQGMETSINNAYKYQNEELPKAEASADRTLQEAEATKASRVNEGLEEVAMFNAMYEEYAKDPAITRMRMFYEAMEKILPAMKIIINNSDGQVQTIYPLESFSEVKVEGGNE